MTRRVIASAAAAAAFAMMMGTGYVTVHAENNNSCGNGLPTAAQVRAYLQQAPDVEGDAGGLFHGRRMWASVVNRAGQVCYAVASTDDPTDVWPGSQAIAKAKAYTANAFSLDILPLSTARLYTFTQPGHSLWSLGQSNLFNSEKGLAVPTDPNGGRPLDGGLIFFGGGVPLYNQGALVGGLGISGDTSCTDHEIAKRVRNLAGLNPPGGEFADDIVYTNSVFAHPMCLNTFKNGAYVGEEKTAQY